MGGFFSAPSPPALPPAPETPDPAIEEELRRKTAIERKRRGRRGLITTSHRGLLGSDDPATYRPTLLGE